MITNSFHPVFSFGHRLNALVILFEIKQLCLYIRNKNELNTNIFALIRYLFIYLSIPTWCIDLQERSLQNKQGSNILFLDLCN